MILAYIHPPHQINQTSNSLTVISSQETLQRILLKCNLNL